MLKFKFYEKIAVSGYFDPIHVKYIEYINNAKSWVIG